MFHNGKKTLTFERKLKSQAKLYNFPRQTIQTESIVLETISTTKPEHTYFQIKAELVYRECSPRQFSGSLAVNSGRIRLGTCLQQKCCRLLDYHLSLWLIPSSQIILHLLKALHFSANRYVIFPSRDKSMPLTILIYKFFATISRTRISIQL